MYNLDELRIRQAEFEPKIKDINKEYLKLEKLRHDFVFNYFPIGKIKNMNVDDYVEGRRSKKSFCYWIEHKMKGLGYIPGPADKKFGIYFKNNDYYSLKKFNKTGDAFDNIKLAILELLESGQKNDIKNIVKNPLSSMFKGKILFVYYPNRFLNIFSERYLNYYLDKLGLSYDPTEDEVYKRDHLLEFKNNDAVMRHWNNYLFSFFLYDKFGIPIKSKDGICDELKDYIPISFFDINKIKCDVIKWELKPLEKSEQKEGNTKKGKINFEKENKINCKIGERGEMIVMKMEKDKLISLGKNDLADRVERKSEESDSFGYDILSFDQDGREIYIEVKSTQHKADNNLVQFFISSNECSKAMNCPNYYIYIVFEVNTEIPKILKIENLPSLKGKINIEPVNYKISFPFSII
jgi:hypothetical protein